MGGNSGEDKPTLNFLLCRCQHILLGRTEQNQIIFESSSEMVAMFSILFQI